MAEERDRDRQVIDGLRRRYARRFRLKPVLWEYLPLQADMSFRQGIDVVLSKENGVAVAVFILWSRLGSAAGPGVTSHAGPEYRSGTERELDLMLEARRHGGTGTGPGRPSSLTPAATRSASTSGCAAGRRRERKTSSRRA